MNEKQLAPEVARHQPLEKAAFRVRFLRGSQSLYGPSNRIQPACEHDATGPQPTRRLLQDVCASENDVASGPGEVAQKVMAQTGPRPFNRIRSQDRRQPKVLACRIGVFLRERSGFSNVSATAGEALGAGLSPQP